MNNTSNLYRRNQVFYHQFLTSAIAVLFLASTHAPLQFSSQCRTEFYMALELVKDMSAQSWVSQRLWRTIRSLKAYAPRLGLGEDDQRSGSAMTMAGLASGNIHGSSSGMLSEPQNPLPPLPMPISRASSFTASRAPSHQFSGAMPQSRSPTAPPASQQQQAQGLLAAASEDQNNGQRLKSEMTAIFEGYMGLNGRRKTVPEPLAHLHPNGPLTPGSARVVSPLDGGDGVESVYPIFKDLF
jgi:hypothetical protein